MNVIKRISSRRNDKIQWLAVMFIGAMIPISLFWIIPNTLATWREEATKQAVEDKQISDEQFRLAYAPVITLCASDSGEEPTGGNLPEEARILVLRYGVEADFQAAVNEEMRPDGVDDVNLVICLSREVTYPSKICEDGTTPDFDALTTGYEQEAGVQLLFGQIRQHPELAGRVLARYRTDVRVYKVETGELLIREELWGSEALICSEPPDISPVEYTTGEALLDEVRHYIDGERLEIDAFKDWLDSISSLPVGKDRH